MSAVPDFVVRNLTYAQKLKDYTTPLTPREEEAFSAWVDANQVPYDPSPSSDYDMKGFWKALQSGNERATTAINPNDGRLHFPDYWKTPYHHSFSNESKFATDGAPRWNDKDQLVMPDGTIVFDERRQKISEAMR